MQVTKNLAELCALLIDELYGELPSRIFATLLNRGRSNLAQLAQHTSLTTRQLRHGVAVLIQQNLLYYYVENDTKLTTYEANPVTAYNLIRTGKILELAESTHNAAVKDVMQTILLVGQTRIADLKAAYEEKIRQSNITNPDEDIIDDESKPVAKKTPFPVKSIAHLNSIICRIIEAELVDVVHRRTFTSPEDIYRDVQKQVADAKFPEGVKGGAKAKAEFADAVAQELRKVRGESKCLKRRLDDGGASAAKRRKLFSGIGANGDQDGDVDPVVDPKHVIRVNYDRCLVELRNRRLVQFATEMVGETTGYVYAVLLRQLTKRVSRCHTNPMMDIGDQSDDSPTGPPYVATMEILDNLSTSVDVSIGIGKASRADIKARTAEKLHPQPPKQDDVRIEVDGNVSSDEDAGDSDFESGESDYDTERETKPALQSNGTGEGKVRFDDSAAPKETRVDQMRQHLLLLCESKLQFVRHCGRGKWTVDFEPLIQRLREAELDVVIERTAGRQGLRLVRILRQKGKLDEKTLPSIALVKKPDVQNKMLEMKMAGFVDIQEVPRDNSRTANRTLFLWFSDTDRCLGQLLDKTYKAMLRCLQTLAVHRRKEKDVLMLTGRSDVKGREKDVMQKEYYDRFARFLDTERKLLGHMMRLDELVAVLRDY